MCVKRTHLWPFFLSPSCTVSWRTRASARLYASAAFSSFCATVPPPPLPLLTFPLLPCRAFAPAPAPEALELPRTTEDLRRSSCSAFSSASCGIWWRWRIIIIRFSFGSRVSRIACGSSYTHTPPFAMGRSDWQIRQPIEQTRRRALRLNEQNPKTLPW